MAFHEAKVTELGGILTKIYVLRVNGMYEEGGDEVLSQVERVYESNQQLLDHGDKYVLIVWSENETPMIDWWIWGENESDEAGSMIEVYLFRDNMRYESPVVTAEDGLQILASETN